MVGTIKIITIQNIKAPLGKPFIPDSAKEMNLVKIIQYDLERREKTDTQ